MSFFSDFFDTVPHQTIGQKAKEYCINSFLSENEARLIAKYKIDREEYIKVRNVCQISMFIAMFVFMESKNPNARYGITYLSFRSQFQN